MVKSRLYLETSVPSYLASRPSRDLVIAAHQQITREWWESRLIDFDVYISQFVLDEAAGGDPEAANKRLELLVDLPQLEINDDTLELANILLRSSIMPKTSATDAAHIAVSAVHRMDFLATWNCAHIANARMSKAIRDICLKSGFSCPVICTPEELMGG
jgi:hypothetical protein